MHAELAGIIRSQHTPRIGEHSCHELCSPLRTGIGWCERPTALARSKSTQQRILCGAEELTIRPLGCSCGTTRTTEDARRLYADEELPDKRCIAAPDGGIHRPVGEFACWGLLDHHAHSMAAGAGGFYSAVDVKLRNLKKHNIHGEPRAAGSAMVIRRSIKRAAQPTIQSTGTTPWMLFTKFPFGEIRFKQRETGDCSVAQNTAHPLQAHIARCKSRAGRRDGKCRFGGHASLNQSAERKSNYIEAFLAAFFFVDFLVAFFVAFFAFFLAMRHPHIKG